MKLTSSFGGYQIISASALVGLSVLIGLIGVNEFIIGVVTFINSNYGLFFGGNPIDVKINNGILRGFYSHPSLGLSRDGRSFYEFLGVPFAQPPIGHLRFKPPVPMNNWEGIRDARSYAPKCTQFDPFIHLTSGSEDCLYLNVFTPKIKISEGQQGLPVIVYIHGGLYMFGRAELFRPDYIMDEDVVIVSIHYRLGPFGFLNMGTEEIRGNMGLKDQVLAMKWVQQNIAKFGGNPNVVTLMGESAGAASIHLHMLSPLSKGLFHRAVTMSGTALNHWAFNKKPNEQLELFANRMHCNRNNTGELFSCLQNLETNKIAEVFQDVNDRLHHRLSIFAPTIEPFKDSTTFLYDTPQNLLKNGKIHNAVPWLNGVNAHEGLIYAVAMLRNTTCTKKLNEEWERRAPSLFDYEDFPLKTRNIISNKIRSFYIGNETFTLDIIYNVVDMFSDSSFNIPLEQSAHFHGNISNAPMYLYYYSYRSKCALAQFYMNMLNFIPVALDGLVTNAWRWIKHEALGLPEKHYGVCHGDELVMLFQLPRVICTISPKSLDYKFSKSFIKLWTTFALNGEPMIPEGTNGWPSVQHNRPLQYLNLEMKSSIIEAPFKSRLHFWKDLNIYNS